MFTHPPSRRQDCPKGELCLDAHCTLLHPATRNVRPSSGTAPTATSSRSHSVNFTHAGSSKAATTTAAESALKLLMTVVDSNEDFMSVPENRRLLEILGLKAKKTQAVIDEDYQNAH